MSVTATASEKVCLLIQVICSLLQSQRVLIYRAEEGTTQERTFSFVNGKSSNFGVRKTVYLMGAIELLRIFPRVAKFLPLG